MGKSQAAAFATIKQAVVEAIMLVLCDPNCDVFAFAESSANFVFADKSGHSLRAVLLQRERPFELIAKSLTETQQRYSHRERQRDIEKEAFQLPSLWPRKEFS